MTLGNDVDTPSMPTDAKKLWTVDETTATYSNQTATAGYSVSSDGKGVEYAEEKYETLYTVEGVTGASGDPSTGATLTTDDPSKVTIKVEDTTLKPTAVKFTVGDQLYTPTTVDKTEGSNLIKTFDTTTNDIALKLSTSDGAFRVFDNSAEGYTDYAATITETATLTAAKET